MINGIIKIGFKIIGKLKIIGLLILKIVGIKDVLESVFEYLDFEKNSIVKVRFSVVSDFLI